MVSRCGCSGGCACYVVGGDSIGVVGNGSIANPYLPQVDFTKTGSTACLRLMRDCASRWMGDGMQYVPPSPDDGSHGTIGIKISTQPGNLAKIGSDGGVYVAAPTGPPTISCTKTVASLPKGTVFGRTGAGSAFAPWHIIRSARMAEAIGLDGIVVNVMMLADGSLICAPYPTFDNTWTYDKCLVAQNSGGCERYAHLPFFSQWYDTIGLSQWKNLVVTTEDWYDASYNNQWGANTVGEFLDELGGKINIAWLMLDSNFTSDANRLRMRQNLLAEIKRTCTQQSTIVLATQNAYLDPFLAETNPPIDTGVFLQSNTDFTNNPAATLQSKGVKWAFLDWKYRNHTEFTKYSAAGIKTMAVAASRRSQLPQTYAAPYNFYGNCSEDPVYTGSKSKPLTMDAWAFDTFMEGQVWEQEDTTNFRTRLRGFPYDSGWCMPPKGTADMNSQITLGWASPFPLAAITTGNNLIIEWDQMWEPNQPIPPWDACAFPPPSKPPAPSMPTAGSLGIMIMMKTDQPIMDFPPADPVTGTTPPAFMPPDYYWCSQQVDGTLRIDGASALQVPVPSAAFTNAGSAPVAGSTQHFQIIVRPNNIAFRLMGASGTSPAKEIVYTHDATTTADLRSNLSTRYVALRKSKPAGSPDFHGIFYNLTVGTTSL